MADTDILGYWIFYVIIGAVVIWGTFNWIDSFRDGTALENLVVEEDLYFLFSALNNMDEGNITILYPIAEDFEVKKSGDLVFLARGGVVKEINMFDSEIRVFIRNKDLIIKKNG